MDQKKKRWIRKFLYWAAYTVIAPVGLLISVWGIVDLVPSARGTPSEIFGTGDLLPLASILLLSASADIRVEEEEIIGAAMTCFEVLFLLTGMGAIVFYAIFKTSALELLRMPGAHTSTLNAYAEFSWAYVAFAVLLTVPVKAR